MAWAPDPTGAYHLRWFDQGRPTAWVMDREQPPTRDRRMPGPPVAPYVRRALASADPSGVRNRTPHLDTSDTTDIAAASMVMAMNAAKMAVKSSWRLVRFLTRS
jgi:hypothetical protein